MKIVEKKSDFKIELSKLSADQKLRYYDNRKKDEVVADWIDKTPFWNKNHVLVYSGACGSGKTTTCLSLISSRRKNSRVYAGCFDMVIINAPISTLKSLENNPFEDLDDEQIFNKFDEEFLDYILEKSEENSLNDKDTLTIIDDASNQLKSNRRVIDKLTNLVCKHRHLKLTIHLLVQDLIQLPLSIRENISGVICFKPINSKRMKLFHEEYLSDLSYKEFLELNEFLYKKKGDFLFIKFSLPREFYKNFDRIFISSSINNAEDETKNKKESKTPCESKIS